MSDGGEDDGLNREVEAPLVSSTKALTCAWPMWYRKPTAWAWTTKVCGVSSQMGWKDATWPGCRPVTYRKASSTSAPVRPVTVTWTAIAFPPLTNLAVGRSRRPGFLGRGFWREQQGSQRDHDNEDAYWLCRGASVLSLPRSSIPGRHCRNGRGRRVRTRRPRRPRGPTAEGVHALAPLPLEEGLRAGSRYLGGRPQARHVE